MICNVKQDGHLWSDTKYDGFPSWADIDRNRFLVNEAIFLDCNLSKTIYALEAYA